MQKDMVVMLLSLLEGRRPQRLWGGGAEVQTKPRMVLETQKTLTLSLICWNKVNKYLPSTVYEPGPDWMDANVFLIPQRGFNEMSYLNTFFMNVIFIY